MVDVVRRVWIYEEVSRIDNRAIGIKRFDRSMVFEEQTAGFAAMLNK
ncbi:hypothetical protein SAMN05216417_12131 [Nitrosospira multiformis]|uniref:Uncharacterized protein n=1 Tax=Nitrosospira multiformis TaxID=1231 RepID=A0A1I7ILJ1_9PROT|nr:hypothetical protein SAMN05216417_12131 [Nitrosospira multiformis]